MLLASSWDPQDSLGSVPRLRPGPLRSWVWCEVGRSLLSANAQCLRCHHSLNYSPSLGSQMERGGLVGRRADPAEALHAASHTSVRLLGPFGALLRSRVPQAEFPELGETPGLPCLCLSLRWERPCCGWGSAPEGPDAAPQYTALHLAGPGQEWGCTSHSLTS